MRVGLPLPEKLLKWRKSLFALEQVALGNRQRTEWFGDQLGVVRNWNPLKLAWMKGVYCENTGKSGGSQIEEAELGLGKPGKLPGTFALPLLQTKSSLNILSLCTYIEFSSLLKPASHFNHPLTNGNLVLQFNMTHQIFRVNRDSLHSLILYSSRWQNLIGPSWVTCPHVIQSAVPRVVSFGILRVWLEEMMKLSYKRGEKNQANLLLPSFNILL